MKKFKNSWLAFYSPFSKVKCDNCKNDYDALEASCPKCKCLNTRREGEKSLFEGPHPSPIREICVFLMGFIGFQFLGIIISFITQLAKASELRNLGYSGTDLENALVSYTESSNYIAIVNYTSYFILFICLLLILWKQVKFLIPQIFNYKTLLGIPLGFLILGVSIILSIIESRLGGQTNQNQTSVIKMVQQTPFLAILITGIIGPLCEELTYRFGLFDFGKRINRIIAYLFASVLFGLIHLHDYTSINEWISFPSYLVTGFLLAFIYEKFGLGASFVAHSVNNLVAIIQILLLGNASE